MLPEIYPSDIKRFRISLGLSQVDFGKLFLRSRTSVGKWENGDSPMPELMPLILFALDAIPKRTRTALIETALDGLIVPDQRRRLTAAHMFRDK